MLDVLLALTLTWTNPSMKADSSSCYGTQVPLTDLDKVHIEAHERWSSAPAIVLELDETGREGQSRSYDLVIPNTNQWTIMLWCTRKNGVRSCTTVRGINQTLDVTPVQPVVRWYDVAGRKIDRPTAPGVYFKVVGETSRRIIVIR